ncbi:hypothetical protein QBC45DRAFT_434380 [Copromyces sp. CBS 386.78]|nr:hypothetical protein QBC45DRAFT_434380 [Copromyces sp. CBS 386.78]
MRDIKWVASDLKTKLALQEDGTTALKDKQSIIRLLRAKTGFALSKKDYAATLSRLKAANDFLESLANAGMGQYNNNKRRSDYRVISLLRKLVKSLFSGLENAAIDCCCPVPHNAYLELVARDLVFIHNIDKEELVARDIDFHVTLSSGGSSQNEPHQSSPPWTSFRLQCGDPKAPPPPTITSTSTIVSPCPQLNSQTSKDLGALSPAVKWTTELLKSKKPGQSNKRQKTGPFPPDMPNATHTLALLAGLSFAPRLERQADDTDVEVDFKICQLSTYHKGKKRAPGRDDLSHGCITDPGGPRTF